MPWLDVSATGLEKGELAAASVATGLGSAQPAAGGRRVERGEATEIVAPT